MNKTFRASFFGISKENLAYDSEEEEEAEEAEKAIPEPDPVSETLGVPVNKGEDGRSEEGEDTIAEFLGEDLEYFDEYDWNEMELEESGLPVSVKVQDKLK